MRPLNKYIKLFSLLLIISLFSLSSACQNEANQDGKESSDGMDSIQNAIVRSQSESQRSMGRVVIGAENLFEKDLALLEGKTVAVVGNQTTRFFNGTHLVDSLLSRGVAVKKVFAPEHGFRGTADAGEFVKDGVDTRTGLPIISLYGKNKKPSQEQLAGIDMVVFDIQDVGVRLYTYISTMTYVMEACAEAEISFMVLDRPNPNGYYVDGPVLKKEFSSFIGLHEIPIVHGMTLAEYAKMVQAEYGLEELELSTVLCSGYRHEMKWKETGWPWRSPSPNLASVKAASLYPGLVLFEPTPMSVGRGTDSAFTIVGAPWFKPESDFRAATARTASSFAAKGEPIKFVPRSLPGKSKFPKFQDEICAGLRFGEKLTGKEMFLNSIVLFQRAYSNFQMMHAAEPFFKKSFNRWPGNTAFKEQIKSGVTAEEIYQSWQEEVETFKNMREKYLLYP